MADREPRRRSRPIDVTIGIATEVIEQIMDEDNGRSVAWLASFLEGLNLDPFRVLWAMSQHGLIEIRDEQGKPLDEWQVAELVRNAFRSDTVAVHATEKGFRLH